MNAEKLTELLESLTEKYEIPSGDCIVYKNHEVIYRHMCGTVDENRKELVRKDQRYLMFSMTKVQTMTALMQLVEKGLISLEDEVSKYLPSYKDLKVECDGKAVPAVNALKVKHLVSMQSGLDYDLSRPGILRVLKEKGENATTRELVDAFPETPLKFEPGTSFLYSLSHDVVAAIVEVVSGMRYSEYLKKNIWEPLSMKDTFFAHPMNDDVERLARQNIADEKGKVTLMEQSCNYQFSENYESGGAGLISTTEDYAVFADTLANGGVSKDGVRIINPETIEIMKQNLLCDKSLNDIANSMGRHGYGYGVGMQVLMNPELINSPAPAGVFGWDGACGSAIMMDTKSKTSVVFTMHVRGCGAAYGIIHPAIRDIVFGE